MTFISVFDVLGRNMIGPSSSHTAGAASIALMARKMFGCPVLKATSLCTDPLPKLTGDTAQTAPF